MPQQHDPLTADRESYAYCGEWTAAGRWENEGGSMEAGTFGAATAPPTSMPPARPDSEDMMDARQDELMAAASSDGRPPTHRQRTIGWRWFAVGGVGLMGAMTAWIAIDGMSVRAIGAGLALVVLLLLGALPVMAAGLLRGGEEREARKGARLERRRSQKR